MGNKSDISKLLKDCPSGMELDCTMYEDVCFDYVDELNIIHCYIQRETHKTSLTFNQHGTPNSDIKSKCVIFPKGETTWEGFVPPCEFKEGDIISADYYDDICIFKDEGNIKGTVDFYCGISGDSDELLIKDVKNQDEHFGEIDEYKLATEKEKEKLFKVIKYNGYKWNPETKTLEKLVKPEFKVGDIIQDIDSYKVKITEVNIEDRCYEYESMFAKGIGSIEFSEQDNWELVPNKFDINTLVPFESRVLVRDYNDDIWRPAIFGVIVTETNYNDLPFVVVGGSFYDQCIPYEGNEHLSGKTDDCDEYFKNW